MTRLLVLGIAAVAVMGAQQPQVLVNDPQALLNQYCATCHNAIAVEESSPEILRSLGLAQ